MAVLSAEWLAHRFQMNVLVLVRHPAAFVSSCKQLGWGFHFENLLHQPLLIDKYFKQFEAEIIDHVNYEHELIDKLTLLWKLIYTAVIDYQDNNPEWLILRYEDICSQPLSQFNHIFKTFNIEFSTTAQKFIQESTNYSQFKGIFQEIHSIKRNAKAQIDIWKERLSQQEIDSIRSKVEDVSQHFYTDEDW
ncbi:MAG: hypothetical protein F6J98_32440 [Moorea sp. SIO4G2]|nr:hypothetical protein [Moorena sp. SIO4G2]